MSGVHATLSALIVPIERLRPYEGNPRRGNLDVLTDSLVRNGQYRPVVANRRNGQVLAGNHTLAAALSLGWDELAVTWVDVDDETAARIALVDNRANDLAGYDDASLAALLESLTDWAGTGFSDDEVAQLLAAAEPPVDLVRRALENSSQVGGGVLDLFAGSGSLAIAAYAARRRSWSMELDPVYVDVICRRWQEHTGQLPVLEATGQQHDDFTAAEVVGG